MRWRGLAGPLADYVLPAPFLAPWDSPVSASAPGAAGAGAVRGRCVARPGDGTARRQRTASRRPSFWRRPPRLGLAAGLRLGGRRLGGGAPLRALAGARGGAPGGAPDRPGCSAVAGALAPLRPATAARPGRRARTRRRPGPAPSASCSTPSGRGASPAGTLRRRFDNRYDYPDYLLPPPRRLRAWGVGRALWAGPSAALPARPAGLRRGARPGRDRRSTCVPPRRPVRVHRPGRAGPAPGGRAAPCAP